MPTGAPIRSAATAKPAGRILVVDDDADKQKLIGLLRRRAGADVAMAEKGGVALATVLATRTNDPAFDLVLMDMQMPRLDGIAATRALRDRGNRTPIVTRTANVLPEHRRRALAAGCDDCLPKPIDRESLDAACARWIAAGSPATSG